MYMYRHAEKGDEIGRITHTYTCTCNTYMCTCTCNTYMYTY